VIGDRAKAGRQSLGRGSSPGRGGQAQEMTGLAGLHETHQREKDRREKDRREKDRREKDRRKEEPWRPT